MASRTASCAPTPIRLAAITLLALTAAMPAQAAERWWTFIGGCGSADWVGTTAGPNAQGQFTCWSGSAGGSSGVPMPVFLDDVFIDAPFAIAPLIVDFAAASRPDFAARAHELWLRGSAFAPAGLHIARQSLQVELLVVGERELGRPGQLDISGGRFQAGTAVLSAGSLNQSGGDLVLGNLFMRTGTTGGLDVSTTVSAGRFEAALLTLQGTAGQTARFSLLGGQAEVANTRIGDALGGGPAQLWLRGSGARWNGNSMRVGSTHVGELLVDGGAQATLASLSLGLFAPPGSQAVLSDTGSRIDTGIAELRSGTVEIRQGATLAAGQLLFSGDAELALRSAGRAELASGLAIASTSRVVLEGGWLRTPALSAAPGGVLDWRAGTLEITGSDQAHALDGNLLPGLLKLAPGDGLLTAGTLTVPAGATLLLDGGTLRATTLHVQAGALLASTDGGAHALQMDGIGTLHAAGTLLAPLQAALASPRLIATGALSLGLATRSDGIRYAGRLESNGHAVSLLDSDIAELSGEITLDGSARLASLNGLHLGPGGVLRSRGIGTVQGEFVNDGLVDSTGGRLAFEDAVSGGGAFAGDLIFSDEFAPGSTADAIVDIGFNGGSARFDATSTLSLQLDSPLAFDRLSDLFALSVEGRLNLQFGAGFSADDGALLQLLDFDSFGGSFAQVVVQGFPAWRVDSSMLGLNGTLRIAPVPEPPAALLAFAGLLLLWRRRRWHGAR